MNDANDNLADSKPGRFVDEIVLEDLARDTFGRPLLTRFPPEPNGYLHIGHAKSICLNFGVAALHPDGRCNLRFDDTNPAAEDEEFVEAIQEDVRWLGFQWNGEVKFASDYFEQLYEWAEKLIREGKAYVDSQSLEQIRENRGNFYKPGIPSPDRDRSVEENLDLFRRMRAGEFEEGQYVLRAKIDMQSKDLKLRDPVMYRIRKVPHHRTGDEWCIYPMYDWAHGQSDAIEGITHSICTLEFQNHRGLYEWFLEALGIEKPPKQIEFARLNLTYTVLSKRKLQQLVEGGHVSGWDDPRMPTLAGMRRRGVPPAAIRNFCDRIGVSRKDGVVDVGLLEHEIREELNRTAPRRMAVLRPLRVVIENFPEGEALEVEVQNNPERPEEGTRKLLFTREVFIERDDFMEVPMKKWFRLSPGAEVRLRGACIIRCNEVVKDASGEIVELRCTWDEQSKGGAPADGRKIKGTLHWVSAAHAVDAEVRLYDRLFHSENPAGEENFLEHLNPESLEVIEGAKLEPSLGELAVGEVVQFERLGYFARDRESTADGRPVFNRTITLKDSWAKIAKSGA
ncbi:MAG: glutamine--tRNA ligase/YqeY domain fusion protein [Myxococcales bacterium]|nr:glutamine--tRNA ligase/YqeY domain fusion protein [Myxococcales bacterium]